MTRVPGSASAEILLRVGLGRTEVVRALIREIGLDELTAERAWAAASHKADAADPYHSASMAMRPSG